MIKIYEAEKEMYAGRGEDAPEFEEFLLSIIEQNIQNETGAADNG